MPERQLDLFERRMAAMGQFSKCATQIMRSDVDPQFLGVAPNNKGRRPAGSGPCRGCRSEQWREIVFHSVCRRQFRLLSFVL